ncbi:MAG: methyltransferase domain-containing protein [Spirosomataceae bacterium]
MDFSRRSYQPELIDDLNLNEEALAQNLRELERTNYWLGGNQVTIRGFKRLIGSKKTPLTVADLGCGGGDMLLTLAKWLRKKRLNASLIGIDANAFMIDYAQQRTASFAEIRYEQQDVFSETFKQQTFDVVMMTLFCHHFTDEQLLTLFKGLRQQARVGIIINDLHRHWLAYYSIQVIAQLLGASYLYRHDSKLSVLRAFKRTELATLLSEAGFQHVQIRWRWAFRWEVVAWS